MLRLFRFSVPLASACLAIIAFGCAWAAENTTYPIVIKHALGTTTIARKPERVATVAWANHEVPLALGIVPVGFAAANFGDDDGDGVPAQGSRPAGRLRLSAQAGRPACDRGAEKPLILPRSRAAKSGGPRAFS